MYIYAILQDPGHNRVYYSRSQALALAELKIACRRFETPCKDVKMLSIAAINYLSFEAHNELSEHDLKILSRLSFVFALFQYSQINGKTYLTPVVQHNYRYIDPKISSILKYPGKTNELFTRMMINVALLSSDFAYDDDIKLLDPIAGRGTTLFEGSVYGYDVFGIELEKKSVHEASVFFKKYLEKERYKHDVSRKKFNGKDRADSSNIMEFAYAQSKEEFKSAHLRKQFSLVEGNTTEADRFYKNNNFNIIVGDLPYGVAHGNVAGKKQTSITRNPKELLSASLAAWNRVLKKGGALVLSWNKFVLPKDEIIHLMSRHNFEVITESPYDEFEHRVDMMIKRDIVVARK
jgi:tRNA G10  N-methylase Trm11